MFSWQSIAMPLQIVLIRHLQTLNVTYPIVSFFTSCLFAFFVIACFKEMQTNLFCAERRQFNDQFALPISNSPVPPILLLIIARACDHEHAREEGITLLHNLCLLYWMTHGLPCAIITEPQVARERHEQAARKREKKRECS